MNWINLGLTSQLDLFNESNWAVLEWINSDLLEENQENLQEISEILTPWYFLKKSDKWLEKQEQLDLETKELFNELLYLSDSELKKYIIHSKDNFIFSNKSFNSSINSNLITIIYLYRNKIKKTISLIEHFYWVNSEILSCIHDLKQCKYFDIDVLKQNLSKSWTKKLLTILK